MSRLSGRMCHCLFCNAEILDHLVLVTRIKVSFLFFFSLKSYPNQLIWLHGLLSPEHAWKCIETISSRVSISLVQFRVINLGQA